MGGCPAHHPQAALTSELFLNSEKSHIANGDFPHIIGGI
jgi:hypothetical protein